MKFPLAARIAWRYLRAKKSHSAVGAISMVSICGIAVATAAIICVLSVFNGFQSVIADRLDTLSPDIMVTPAKGKVITDADSLALRLRKEKGVDRAIPTILDNALLIHNGYEIPVQLKGVDLKEYSKITALPDLLIATADSPDSLPPLEEEEYTPAIASIGISSRVGARPGDGMLLFAPRREGRVNLANPSSSFLRDSVRVEGIYQANQSDYDDARVIVDLEAARELFQYDTEASAIEISAAPGVDTGELMNTLADRLGPDYKVRDRLRQQEMNFRMVSIEKWVSFLLLLFILLIASFNIISSLSMLVIEKEGSISTLRAMGLSRARIGNIFAWESVMVTASGAIAGIILGVALCLLQEKFGFIRLQGDPQTLVTAAYPVSLQWQDILVTLIPLSIMALVAAGITSAFARHRK